jgi:alkanesulfonate monooxygenase SsuD/methylene tetrahydromethanopterin reductase-like flavin-dependent oxidoreductase (luciferase family)
VTCVDIAIGLPTTIPGATREQLLEWARRADAAGFSSLGTIDRLVYSNYEPLVALGAAAAVTERVRLLTSVLLVPWRLNAALLAKQAASLHRLSNGRLVLGVAVGGRADDFEASGIEMTNRGPRMEEMLDEITRVWQGQERGSAGAIGPDVSESPPTLIVGGGADAVFKRAARYADGWILGAAPPDAFPEGRDKAIAAFEEAGRAEKPRLIAESYFSLSGNEDQIRSTIGDYYAFVPEYSDFIVANAAKGPDGIRERAQRFEELGCDELVFFPDSADPEQVEQLAELVL